MARLDLSMLIRMRAWAVLLTWFAVLSCEGSAPASDPLPDADPAVDRAALPAREEFVRGALISPGASRDAIFERLGTPDSSDADLVPNRHLPGVLDTIFTLHYPDLRVTLHRPGPGGELLSSVEVGADRYLRYGVIGLPADQLVKSLGPPDEGTPTVLTYLCTTCVAGDDPVQFLLDSGRVRAVRFSYYVD